MTTGKPTANASVTASADAGAAASPAPKSAMTPTASPTGQPAVSSTAQPAVSAPANPAVLTSSTAAPAASAPSTRDSPPKRDSGGWPRLPVPGVGGGPGLTGPGAVVLAVGLVGLGAGPDLLFGDGLGLLFSATFLLSCLLVAVTVRRRALLTAVALPPLLFAGCAVLAAKVDGRASGTRELALDVGTTLALSAPVLFAGTAAACAIAIVRGVAGLVGADTKSRRAVAGGGAAP